MKFLAYLTSVFLLACLLCVAYLIIAPNKPLSTSITSPLPPFLTLGINKEVSLLDLWLPSIQKTQGNEIPVPDHTARAVLMYDLSTGTTLYEENATKRMPMASLTKIMTAIIAFENKNQDDHYVVHKENLVGEDSMGLDAGEVLNQEELLYGMMLKSGNDAAEVFATNYPAGRQAFIQAMNDKAKALGLSDTQFSNPSGLQGDGTQYTTAYDLLVMTRYALDTFPLFDTVVATYEHQISATSTHKAYDLYNETNLLTSYPGVKGVKTGYTPEAGLCLVTLLDYHGHRIIGILLNSENRRQEMKEFLDYSLKKLDIEPPAHE